MRKTPIARKSWMKRGETPLAPGKPPVRKTRIRKANLERQARVQTKRDAKAKTPEQRKLEREARRIADQRANGMCECGCGFPFGEYRLDRKHFHHTSTSAYGKHVGIMVRRRCHERIEMEQFGYRHHKGRKYT